MSSSKFSSRPPARKRPAVCKAPIVGSSCVKVQLRPLTVNTYVHFKDDDILAPGEQVDSFLSNWSDPLQRYFGKSRDGVPRMELTFAPQGAAALWTAILKIWDPYRNPETFSYSDIFVDPTLPFATPWIGDVVIDSHDFRVIRLME